VMQIVFNRSTEKLPDPALSLEELRGNIRLAFDPLHSHVTVPLGESAPVVKSFSIRNGSVTPGPIEIVQRTQETNHVL
jgi:hypothetical protein